MTTIDTTTTTTIEMPGDDFVIDDAQLAAVAFLARYSGRTLDAYRHDLRGFFQWAGDNSLAVLAATRPHIELYRAWMDDRGLAASTIDRRLSTVCGFYRFAHIDGRIASNPAQYVSRPQVHPSTRRGRSTRTGTTCVPSSSGRPTTSCLSSTRRGRTSSCTAPRWKRVGLQPPRSTVDCRQCVASTGSLTSTDESRRTRPSTSVAPRSRPAKVTAWTAPSWARSSALGSSLSGT